MKRTALIAAALFGCTGVMIGAFGAHALEDFLAATGRADTFETAVRYQMYHALLLLFLGIFATHNPSKINRAAIISTIIGILIFSLSLYCLCLFEMPKLGMITPIGGLGLILGWGLLLLGLIRNKKP